MKKVAFHVLAALLGLALGYFLAPCRQSSVEVVALKTELSEAVSSEAALQRQLDDCRADQVR